MVSGRVWLIISVVTFVKSQSIIEAETGGTMDSLETTGTLECHRRMYTYPVMQKDENGKQCWDTISVLACWGRCDSNEISDWRFPYKKSTHPVCIHHGRKKNTALLRNCEEGALPSAAKYDYYEAVSCKCQQCSSSDTSCEGLRYRPLRSYPSEGNFGFQAF